MARVEWQGRVDGKATKIEIETETCSDRAWELFLFRLERGIFAVEMERVRKLGQGKQVPTPQALYNNPFVSHFWHMMMDGDDS